MASNCSHSATVILPDCYYQDALLTLELNENFKNPDPSLYPDWHQKLTGSVLGRDSSSIQVLWKSTGCSQDFRTFHEFIFVSSGAMHSGSIALGFEGHGVTLATPHLH